MKLLTQTTRYYFMLAVALLLLSIPAIYFTLRTVLIHKLDEELREHKNSFFQSLRLITSEKELEVYKHFYEEFSLKEIDYKIEKDSIYTIEEYDSSERKVTPLRILRSGVYLNGKHYELLIRESLITTRDLITIILFVKAGILASLLTGLLVINRKLTKKVFNPFYQTVSNLKKFEIDKDSTIPEIHTRITEFNDLNKVLIQLTQRNHQSYISQKEFTENAAHELQTPLAIIRTKLDLLIQTSEMTNEQAELISELYDATDRINRLNKSLLLLSQIENTGTLDREPANLHELVLKNVSLFNEIFTSKHIVPEIAGGSPIVTTNTALLEILLTNLISNAARFTPDGGAVLIQLTENELIISNTGEPLQNPEKIFNRFHRESNQKTGTGLGLTISKQICKVLGFDLRYRFEQHKHTFILRFNP
ncbi:MAG TPA: HAMP domain-containing sensor histidine kinase [Cyclobacteriaceae bacterium]|nr:HAMP domain-containing sensor histidine kinase [Cyclobacteriaceae bacterium]HRJ81789.1 HAMP domain-containing sensor histidine kinase [Cyclobacteriaceae bacterium]